MDGVHGTAVDRIYEIGQSAKLHRSHRVQIFGSRLRRQVEAIGQQRSFPSRFPSLLVRPGKLLRHLDRANGVVCVEHHSPQIRLDPIERVQPSYDIGIPINFHERFWAAFLS
jgi:hypothetical protein